MQASNNNGSIIIRFTLNGYKYCLRKLGRFDNPKDIALANQICLAVTSDIAIGRFNPKDNNELIDAYHPLARSVRNDVLGIGKDCLWMVNQKLELTRLRDRNLHQTANYLKRYGKPIKSKHDAMKFWNWLQGESKGNNRTINRHLTSLKPVCSYFADIPKLKESSIKDEKPFSKDEIRAIIEALDNNFPHYSPFIKFLFSTGCRPNEATALTWDNVDFNVRTITISECIGMANDGSKVRKETKTGVTRILPMSGNLLNLLECKHIDAKANVCTDLVFYSLNHKVIDIRTFRSRVWVRALELASVPYRTLYNTRHTFCSHFLNETPDFVKLSSITHGTKSGIQTLMKHYAHIVDKPVMPDMF